MHALINTNLNLKVEEHVRYEAPNFFVVLLHFLAHRLQLVVSGERFRDGQYSLVSFLFAVVLLFVPSHL